MSIKIYLVKHHDTGMGYVGITGDELAKRWYQHLHDPKGALYAALRAEGHRMSMQLLEEVETRAEALIKEQEYIHALGTAQPAGWNRDVRPLPVEEQTPVKPKKWISHTSKVNIEHLVLICPACSRHCTHQGAVEVFLRINGDEDGIHTFAKFGGTTVDNYLTDNPSMRSSGIRIFFTCEYCHFDMDVDNDGNLIHNDSPPPYELLIQQHKGSTIFETVYYLEDKS
jgi:hypothetical protein